MNATTSTTAARALPLLLPAPSLPRALSQRSPSPILSVRQRQRRFEEIEGKVVSERARDHPCQSRSGGRRRRRQR